MLEDYPCWFCGRIDGEHAAGCPYYDVEPLMHTQGGGTAEWDNINKRWVFVEPPPDFPQYRKGDFVPEQWGIA